VWLDMFEKRYFVACRRVLITTRIWMPLESIYNIPTSKWKPSNVYCVESMSMAIFNMLVYCFWMTIDV
jgi:hypothetical protein